MYLSLCCNYKIDKTCWGEKSRSHTVHQREIRDYYSGETVASQEEN